MPDDNTDLVNDDTDQTSDDQTEDTKPDDGDSMDDQDVDDKSTGDQKTDDDQGDDSDDDVSVDWGEWSKSHDLPEDIADEGDLAEKYVALLKDSPSMSAEMQQVDALLKARGISGGVQALKGGDFSVDKLSPESGTKIPKQEPFFANNPFSTQVGTMIENGMIKEADQATYRSIAQFNDQTINPIMGKMLSALNALVQQVQSNRDGIGELSYSAISGQLSDVGVEKNTLDSFMRLHNITDPNKGLLAYAAMNDPSLLGKIQSRAEEKGKIKERKKLRRTTGLRRGKGGKPSGSHPGRKWANADGSMNEEAIRGVLGLDEQSKAIKDYEAFAAKRAS